MRVLFDTNVLIDFLLDRAPFAEAAADLLSRADRGQIQGLACADSFTTIFYLMQKGINREAARRHISSLLSVLDVTPVNRATLEQAAESGLRDFEDAVVVESARQGQRGLRRHAERKGLRWFARYRVLAEGAAGSAG